MLLFAHRGYSDCYPENTMLAFLKAIEKGFDGIEIDVHQTKDGQLVVCHDEKIDRTSNGHGYIRDFTYLELLDYTFDGRFQGCNQKIPLLKDVLQLVKQHHLYLNLEVKTDHIHYPGIEEKIYHMVKDYQLLDKVYFSSFYLPSLLTLKELNSQLYLGYLFEDDYLGHKQLCFQYHFHVHCREDFLNADEIQDIRNHHLDINTWTVKNRFRFAYFQEQGVHIAICNKYFEK